MANLRVIVIALFISIISIGGGCSKKEPEINACTLLSQTEVSSLSSGVKGHDLFQKVGDEPEICAWHDGANNNLVMIFYYASTQVDPTELVTNGMKGKKSRIITISGVGAAGAAAFAPSSDGLNSEEMKLFSANNEKGTIGIRARNIGNENSYEFETIKNLANTALSRIE